MVSIIDLEFHKYNSVIRALGSAVAGTATATVAAPGANMRNRICKVDASYSDSTKSGLLQIKSGTTVIFEKYIHAAGAVDSLEWGTPAINLDEAMSAELASAGGAVVGKVTISGFKCPEMSP